MFGATVTHEITRDFTALPLTEGEQRRTGGKPIPFFFREMVKDETTSARLGRAVFKAIEMVRIVIPGDPHSSPVRRVSDEHRQRFPEHYAAFQREEEMAEDGTPIEQWGILTMEQRYHLKHLKLFTVEQVAALTDLQLQNLGMGGLTLRNRAQAYLESTKTGAVPDRLISENELLKTQVRTLMEQVSKLGSQLEIALAEKGVNVAAMENPVVQAKTALEAVVATDNGATVDIPDNYRALGLKQLREICARITSAPVMTKDEAFEEIATYLAKKSAAKA